MRLSHGMWMNVDEFGEEQELEEMKKAEAKEKATAKA